MKRGGRLAALIASSVLLAASPVPVTPPVPLPAPAASWSVTPWLADLGVMREAVETRYANRDWLERERGVSLDSLFGRAEQQLREAESDSDARAVLDKLTRRFADGHVTLLWPTQVAPVVLGAISRTSPCDALGFDARQNSPGAAVHLPGYIALPNLDGLFSTGTVRVRHRTLGVLRIAAFQPQAFPALCAAALAALAIPADGPCDDACQDRILDWTYDRMTRALAERLEALRRAGAQMLLVDISNNGGGTEWVEAVARMVSPVPIHSEERGFVRGALWEKHWKTLAEQLAAAARTESDSADRQALLGWEAQAENARKQAALPCEAHRVCIDRGGFATGLVGSTPAGRFAGKPWASLVFSPTQYPYRDSVWQGPLIVLTDDDAWSAAEQFAAMLQDNRAALVVGQRTGGAGCGHTDGGAPIPLPNSGAALQLPDCIRFRADGSSEVRGVIPDLLVPLRASDGEILEGRMLAPYLPKAMKRARRLRSRAH